MRQRAEVMKRIGTVKQVLSGIANLYGDEILDEEVRILLDRKVSARQTGLTWACRVALMHSNTVRSARELCVQIRLQSPLILARHKDPVASVTTVLHRLTQYGEAQQVIRGDGRRAWEWVADKSKPTSTSSGLPGHGKLHETL
jgi:hypothetical protein